VHTELNCVRPHGHFLVRFNHAKVNLHKIIRRFFRGNYKNIPVNTDKHLLNVILYIERREWTL